jgi:hypothetical protein
MPRTLLQYLISTPSRIQKPASCGHILDLLDKEGNYKIGDEEVCADCYFEALGKEVEEHPIGRRRPRGCA